MIACSTLITHPVKNGKSTNEKLFKFFSVVGFILVSLSLTTGFVGFWIIFKESENQTKNFYRQKATFLVVDALEDTDLSDKSLISHIITNWRSSWRVPGDEYICIVDSNATLIVHTRYPNTTTSYAGDNLILGSRNVPKCTLAELVIANTDYVGGYVSSSGEKQLAVFVPIPEKKWVMGLHRSQSALHREIYNRIQFPFLGFLLTCGLLLPISLILMYRYSKNAWKAQQVNYDNFLISEKKFRTLFEESPISIELFDKNGDLVDFNYATAELFGLLNVDKFKNFNIFRDPNLPFDLRDQLKKTNYTNHQVKFDFDRIRETGQFESIKCGISYLNVYIRELDTLSQYSDIKYLTLIEDITDRKKDEIIIQNNERLLNRISENYPHSYVAIVEKDFTISFISGEELKNDQLSVDDFIGKTIDSILGELSLPVMEEFTKAFSGKKVRFEISTGKLTYQFSGIPLLDEKNEISRILGVAENITERKNQFQQIVRLNRVRAVLSNVNKVIVRTRDVRNLYNEICRIIVENGGFVMAWIGEFNSETGMINIVTSAGETGDYIDNLNIIIDSSKKTVGTTGRAVRDGKPAISNDIENDPEMTHLRDSALRQGYRSSAAFPIFTKNKVIGSFTLYAESANFFDTAEIGLLNELSEDISYALNFIESEKERMRSESLLDARHELMEFAYNGSLKELLVKIVDICEAMTKSQVGFLHFIEDDQITIRSQVWSTNTIENICTLVPDNHSYSVDDAGVWVEAMIRTRPVIHNDYNSIPDRKGLPQGHNPIIRQLVVPVLREGKVKLLLGVGNKKEDYTDEDASQLFKLVDFAWDIYVRKFNEEELIIKDLIFESSVAGNVFANHTTNIVHVNPAFLNIWGYSDQDEIISKSVSELFENETAVDEKLKILNSAGQWEGEITGRRKDGVLFIAKCVATQIRNKKNELIGYFATFLDITNEKQTLQKLRKEEARLSSILKISEGLGRAYTYSDIVRILETEFERVLGIHTVWLYLLSEDKSRAVLPAASGHMEKLITGSVFELKTAEDPLLEEIAEGAHIVVIEDVRTDSRTMNVNLHQLDPRTIISVPFKLENENLAVLGLGTFCDEGSITFSQDDFKYIDTISKQLIPVIDRVWALKKRESYETMLRENEERLKQAFKAARAGAWEHNFKTGHLVWSDEIYTVLGLTPGAMEPSHDVWSNSLHPDDRETVESHINHADDTQQGHDILYRIITPEGEIRWINGISKSKTDEKGEVVGRYGIMMDVTERQNTIEDLQLSEERFRSMFEQAAIGVAIIDQSTREFIRINQKFCDILGYSESEGMALTLEKVIPQGDYQTTENILNKLISHKSSEKMIDTKLVQNKGSMIWVNLTLSVMGESPEHTGYILAIVKDISRRIKSEEDRNESNRQLRLRLNELSAIYQSGKKLQELRTPDDLTQNIIDILETVVGYTHCTILLKDPPSNILIPFAVGAQGKDRDFIEKDKEYILSKKLSLNHGITGHVAKTGESIRCGNVRNDPRYFEMRSNILSELCVPLKIGDKTIGVINVESEKPNLYTHNDQILLETISAQIAIAIENSRIHEKIKKNTFELERQIDQREKYEKELLFNTERMELLRDIDRTIIQELSIDTITAGVSSHLKKLIRCERFSITLTDPDNHNSFVVYAIDSSLPTTLTKGSNIKDQVEWTRDMKVNNLIHVRDIRVLKAPVTPFRKQLLEEGIRSFVSVPMIIQESILGTVNAGSDKVGFFNEASIQILKEVSDHLAIAIHQIMLKKEIEGAAKELENRVAERTRQLENSNKELEDFAHTVSHDLRAPLRSMEGFSDILLDEYGDLLGDQGRDFLQRISRSSSKMDLLIDDLLKYSRLGLAEINLVDVPLKRVFDEVLTGLQTEIDGLPVTLEIPDILPHVMGTQNQLVQIMTNLITNSIKYHRSGVPPIIRIGVGKENSWVVLNVKDNGLGIKPEYHEKIFEIFERLHSDDEIPGTGVGLAIVKKAVGKLNGEIALKSKYNKGTSFTLKFHKSGKNHDTL